MMMLAQDEREASKDKSNPKEQQERQEGQQEGELLHHGIGSFVAMKCV